MPNATRALNAVSWTVFRHVLIFSILRTRSRIQICYLKRGLEKLRRAKPESDWGKHRQMWRI